ncbi:hypothetical protein [Jiella avicenniae]|uniref:Uncharacterized protein n=1 Tax=Jiella avicenniae TaxID=2907202 RepID=A0A9X1NX78_9HYPH|nr:hypothetical protein [Jiella avicenniae]MCE7026435.1 hypothetical protein [Jiella avicenniae]
MSNAPLYSDDRQVIAAPPANTTVLDYDFEIRSEAAMRVLRERGGATETLTLNVDYVFPTGPGDESGGSLQLVMPSLDGDVYTMQGHSPVERRSDFLPGLAFATAKINADLDYLTMIAQEQRRDVAAVEAGLPVLTEALRTESQQRSAADAAETAARLAADAAIVADYRARLVDYVNQGNVPIYATIDIIRGADGAGLTIPEGQPIYVYGQAAVEDGLGGFFVPADTGSSRFFDDASGQRFWWLSRPGLPSAAGSDDLLEFERNATRYARRVEDLFAERNVLTVATPDDIAAVDTAFPAPVINVLGHPTSPPASIAWERVDTEPTFPLKRTDAKGRHYRPKRGLYKLEEFGPLKPGGNMNAAWNDFVAIAKEDYFGVCQLPIYPVYSEERLTRIFDAPPSTASYKPYTTFGIFGVSNGLRQSQIVFPEGVTDAGIYIEPQANNQVGGGAGFTILSEQPAHADDDPATDALASNTSGIGLEVVANVTPGGAGWGSPRQPSWVWDMINVGGSLPFGGKIRGRWKAGFRFENLWIPRISNAWANTNLFYDKQYKQKFFEAGNGFTFLNCYGPQWFNIDYAGPWDTGILALFNAASWDGEGVFGKRFGGAGGPRRGVYIDHTSPVHATGYIKGFGGYLSDFDINAFETAMYVGNLAGLFISEGTLLLGIPPSVNPGQLTYDAETFLQLHNTRNVTVRGVKIPMGGHYTSPTKKSTAVKFTGDAMYNTIDDLTVRANGYGIVDETTGGDGQNYVDRYTPNGTPSIGTGNLQPGYEIVDNGRLTGPAVKKTAVPTLNQATPATGVTYAVQTANYVYDPRRKRCKLWGRLTVGDVGTGGAGATSLVIPGMPLPASPGDQIVRVEQATGFGAAAPSNGVMLNSAIALYIRAASGNSGGALPWANVQAGSSFLFEAEYRTA